MKIRLVFLIFLFVCCSLVSYSQKPGLYVEGRHLYTPAGEKLILKGFNAMIVYWDIHGKVNFPEIEKTGANCVRIFWKINGWAPPASDLDKVLANCISHNMIPIICLWDATGEWDKIQMCLDYWTNPSIAAVLKKYEKNLIVNIANEPGNKAMGDEIFISTYSDAVTQLRSAEILAPLMIDADRWGRNANSVLNTGEELVEKDPEHNLIFSWHLWDPANYGSGTKAEIDRIINTAASKNICFVVGEFGPCERCENCSGTPINWEYLIEKAYQNEIGYLPWVWRWTDCHSCIENEPGHYGDWKNAPWGEGVAKSSPYSIQNTAVRPDGMITGSVSIPLENKGLRLFPNPFSEGVAFEIALDHPASVYLNIYNVWGEKVAALEPENNFSGIYRREWIPKSDQAGGVYFYELLLVTKNAVNSEKGICVKY